MRDQIIIIKFGVTNGSYQYKRLRSLFVEKSNGTTTRKMTFYDTNTTTVAGEPP